MNGQKGANGPNTQKATRRRWPWVVAGVLAMIILLLALAPVILSSQGVTRMVLARINRSTGGTADIGDLSVGWWKGIRISDFSFRNEAGWTRVNISGIDAQPRLGSLLGGTLALGETVIDQPKIEIDLRKRPAPTVVATSSQPQRDPAKAAGLMLLGDVVISDGSVHLTDTGGKTVVVARLDSRLSVRPPGQASRVEVDMIVADAGHEAKVRARSTVTPAKDSGWTWKGTSGEFSVEVNDLDLESIGSFLALAGVEARGKGKVTGRLRSSIADGKLQDVNAVVTGTDLEISGEQLKGDRLQTATLGVDVQLERQGQTYRINKLKATSDWASVTATGLLPTTPRSLRDLLKSDSAYEFDCDLAAILSQMPKTLGIKPGTQIISGRATGRVNTSTQAGQGTMVAQANVTGLAGTVAGKEIKLSEPLVATARLSADEEAAQLDQLDVSAAFATVTARGDLEQIDYDGTVDLAKLEAELGQFVDLGPYQLAGQVSSRGHASIQEDTTSLIGSASVEQFVLSSVEGQRVTEPSTSIDFELSVDQGKQLLKIAGLSVQGSFGHIDVDDGVIPLDAASSAAMALEVRTADLNLQKVRPFAVVLGVLPKELELSGTAQARVVVSEEDNIYRARTEGARIESFRLRVPPEAPFEQREVTAFLDTRFDPERTMLRAEVRVEGPNIRMEGRFERELKGEQAQVRGTLQGQGDPNAVGPLASVFTPEELELKGLSTVDLDFASTYPADDPNALLTHLDSTGHMTLDGAGYKGLNVGPTHLDIQIEDGLMTIKPFTTTMNNGRLNFAAKANFKEKSRLLRTPEPMVLARGIELNKEMTAQMLRYVNPLFANVTGISGVASFECEKLAIPLAAGQAKKAEVVGIISADNVLLEASGLLDQILKATGQSLRGQRLTVRPTKIALANGVVRYDNMQIDVGDNPINFGGAIGLDGRLDMTVTLPWTYRGRTERVGREGRAGTRISVPLRGTIDRPELDVNRLLQDQLLKSIEDLLR